MLGYSELRFVRGSAFCALLSLFPLGCGSRGEGTVKLDQNAPPSPPPIAEQPEEVVDGDAERQGRQPDTSVRSDVKTPETHPENKLPQTRVADHTEPATTVVESSDRQAEEDAEDNSFDDSLAAIQIPPSWLADVQTAYDTTQPWKEARLEIRRLLGLGQPESHREAIKLTWIYLQKNDIGDGHEYPMYTFLGGEPLWSIRAHEEFVKKPHENTPIHSYLTLASLYAQFGAFEKAKAALDAASVGLPEPPWHMMRKADLADAYGDLYAAWGRTDEAKRFYAEAIESYPKGKPPYGRHLLPRRAAKVQSKLDLLAFRSLETAVLKDGTFRDKALGYVGDIHVTLVVRGGKIADIETRHEEKIDQNACVLIPQRIIDQQSLEVDGISGATVTKDAIVNGVYRCLKKAGLE